MTADEFKSISERSNPVVCYCADCGGIDGDTCVCEVTCDRCGRTAEVAVAQREGWLCDHETTCADCADRVDE